jgi:Cu/Ag efflux pump CusA
VPLLQSVLVTAAVLLPAAAFGTAAGLEVLQPMAVTVLGGLVSLVVVQGYVLPAVLASIERPEAQHPEAQRPVREPPRQTRPVTEHATD